MNTFGRGWLMAAKGRTYDEAKSIGPAAAAGWTEQRDYCERLEAQKGQAVQEQNPISQADWVDGIAGGE